jgi:transcriptional regulator with XRE-family HTH domain
MDKFYKELGKRIRKIREKLDLSQEFVAKKIGINRVSYIKIESGERKISADEIAKLSRIFNISSDVLLNLKREIEIVFEPVNNEQKRGKQEIRISVPQKNLEKFREVLLYILNKAGSKPNMGETVIYKLLYFIDFNYYEKYETQLIGATYKKNHYGPTPVEFAKIVDEMIKNGEIVAVENQYFKYPQKKYLPLREADLSILSGNELKIIDSVLERLSDMNARQISEYSHKDVPWLSAEMETVIDYEAVFYRTPEYSVRDSDNGEEL